LEENNVASDHPEVVAALAAMMEKEHKPSAKFNFGRNPVN
jgi:hypothetical protein